MRVPLIGIVSVLFIAGSQLGAFAGDAIVKTGDETCSRDLVIVTGSGGPVRVEREEERLIPVPGHIVTWTCQQGDDVKKVGKTECPAGTNVYAIKRHPGYASFLYSCIVRS